jgi:hypothetical protein
LTKRSAPPFLRFDQAEINTHRNGDSDDADQDELISLFF